VWLEIALLAHDLTVWTQALLLDGELAKAEPKRLRHGCSLGSAASRSSRSSRSRAGIVSVQPSGIVASSRRAATLVSPRAIDSRSAGGSGTSSRRSVKMTGVMRQRYGSAAQRHTNRIRSPLLSRMPAISRGPLVAVGSRTSPRTRMALRPRRCWSPERLGAMRRSAPWLPRS
jgi:hypothetical protein